MVSALMPIEGLFLLLASIQAQIIVKGIRRNETATIKTVRKKHLDIDVTEEIEFHIGKAVLKPSGTRLSGREAAPLAIKSR